MIQTIWRQRSPFNDQTPIKRKYLIFGPKRHAPAGCGPIALAQILTYMNDVRYTFNGRLIDYDRLQNFCTLNNTGNINGVEGEMAAYFLSSLGRSLGTRYSYSFGLTLPISVKHFLERYGYRDVRRTFNPQERKRNVLDALDGGCPVFIASGSRLISFHSWVIDGYRKSVQITKKTDTTTGKVVSSSRGKEALYVHCNYGWHGACNGYYTYDVFDTSAGAKEFANEAERYISEGTQDSGRYHILTNVITFHKR